jgi:hypothetical protein
MKISLKECIEQYKTNLRQSKSILKTVAQIKSNLREKVENIFRGETKDVFAVINHKFMYRFQFEYFDNINKKLLPDLVLYEDTSKDFKLAIEILINYYSDKIERFDAQTINIFCNNDLGKQKNYIKKGMGFQLMNRKALFKKEIQNIRTIQDEVSDTKGSVYTKSDLQRRQDSQKFEINEYAVEDLIDFKSNISDQIEGQNKAFFWIPGELKEKIFDGEKSDKAIYIAYFYYFLRKN